MAAQKIMSAEDSQEASVTTPARAELVKEWIKAYRRPPPKGISTRLLEYAAAYNAQVRQFGGLTPATHRALHALAAEPRDKPGSAGRKGTANAPPAPGTRLVREWHGKTHLVDILENGVSYQGHIYKSLSEVARTITGARWSGPRFFGL